MKFLLALVLSLGMGSVQGQLITPTTTQVTGPVVLSQTPFGLQFAAAYYAAQSPLKLPLYNQRYGGPTAPMLTADQVTALISSLIAQGVTIDEQIDYWGYDPYTTMAGRLQQGILWVPPGLGNSTCASIYIPGCVIVQGQYSGTPPAGSIKTSVMLADYPAWPTPPTPTTPPSSSVGALIVGSYYQVSGPVPPVGTKTGKCTLIQIPSQFMIGGGFMSVWNCQTIN